MLMLFTNKLRALGLQPECLHSKRCCTPWAIMMGMQSINWQRIRRQCYRSSIMICLAYSIFGSSPCDQCSIFQYPSRIFMFGFAIWRIDVHVANSRLDPRQCFLSDIILKLYVLACSINVIRVQIPFHNFIGLAVYIVLNWRNNVYCKSNGHIMSVYRVHYVDGCSCVL